MDLEVFDTPYPLQLYFLHFSYFSWCSLPLFLPLSTTEKILALSFFFWPSRYPWIMSPWTSVLQTGQPQLSQLFLKHRCEPVLDSLVSCSEEPSTGPSTPDLLIPVLSTDGSIQLLSTRSWRVFLTKLLSRLLAPSWVRFFAPYPDV